MAVEISRKVRDRLARIGDDLRPNASILKIVAPELLHVTLKFLGGVEAPRLTKIETAAAEAAAPGRPFVLELGQVGSFPERGAPRVVWIGLNQDRGYRELQRLYERLEVNLEQQGFAREARKFAPHITLARVREGTPAAATRGIQETLDQLRRAAEAHGSFDVSHLTVMRSDLSPAGPKYTPLARLPLGG